MQIKKECLTGLPKVFTRLLLHHSHGLPVLTVDQRGFDDVRMQNVRIEVPATLVSDRPITCFCFSQARPTAQPSPFNGKKMRNCGKAEEAAAADI